MSRLQKMEAGCGDGANLIEVAVAHAKQDQDAPNQVVDVAATHGDVLERPDVVLDGSNQQADGQKSDKEADRRQEHPAVWAVRDGLVEDQAELGEMQQQQHDRRYRDDEYQQDPFP